MGTGYEPSLIEVSDHAVCALLTEAVAALTILEAAQKIPGMNTPHILVSLRNAIAAMRRELEPVK